MHRGIIKFYSEHRGYGYISCEEKAPSTDTGARDNVNEIRRLDDVFVHYSQLQDLGSPREGQEVTFELKDGDRGPEAFNVQVVS
jgi:CspA family cold shock protein